MRTYGRLVSLGLLLGIAGCYGARDTEPVVPDPDGPGIPSDARCPDGQWCWVEGAPVIALDGVAVPGGAVPAVYAVDDGGVLFRWTGEGWAAVAGLEGRRAVSVYVASADDVWIVTEAAEDVDATPRRRLEHFDGTGWSESVEVGSRWVSGAGSDHVWAVPPSGDGYLHSDGGSWREVPAPEGLVFDVLPGPSGELYAMVLETTTTPSGPPSTSVMRHDGASWSRFGSPFDEVGIYSAPLVWSEGELRVLSGMTELRLDGDRWAELPTSALPEGYVLSGDGPRGVAAVPGELRCRAVPVGDEIFCASAAEGSLGGRAVFHGRADGRWDEHRLTPEPSTPLAREQWGAVAPSLWAAVSARSWGAGPDDVLRFRSVVEREPGVAAPPLALERWDGNVWSAVVGPDGVAVTTPWARDLDGVVGEDPWAIAGDTLYRVRGLDATPISMPAALGAIRVRAVAAAPGNRAHAIAHDESPTSARWLILAIDGETVSVVDEQPAGADEDSLELSDLVMGPEGELWVLGVVGLHGRTAGRGFLQRWRAGSSARDPRIDLWDGVWGFHQLERYEDDLYVSADSVYRVPIAAALSGPVLDREAHDLGGRTFTFSTYDAELWVGSSGVWLTTESQARVLGGAP